MHFEKTGTARTASGPVAYTLIAEDILTDCGGAKDAAVFFSFSYIRQAASDTAERPVIFVFNGGPTSASTWLHFGFYGPRILKQGPDGLPDRTETGGLRDNPDCLLDLADLVMYDPVNTGFSRLADPSYRDRCFSDHKDALLAAAFVRAWLARHGREQSPVYLSGESFGSTRAALMAWYLKESVDLRGIINIGPGYSCAEATPRTYKDLIPVSALNWYYTEGTKPTLSEWIAEVRTFLYETYVPAYHLGSDLPADRFAKIAARLSYYTGLPEKVYLDAGLSVNRQLFRKERLKDRGLKLGSYDGRFTLPADADGDPFLEAFEPAADAALDSFLKENGIVTERSYRAASYDDDPDWDWSFDASPDMFGIMATGMPMDRALSEAMSAYPKLRLFFATGFYDTVATVENTRYSVAHTAMDHTRVTLKEYESGHAVYADDRSRTQLAADIRTFLMNE